jgi:hypothetical protein
MEQPNNVGLIRGEWTVDYLALEVSVVIASSLTSKSDHKRLAVLVYMQSTFLCKLPFLFGKWSLSEQLGMFMMYCAVCKASAPYSKHNHGANGPTY